MTADCQTSKWQPKAHLVLAIEGLTIERHDSKTGLKFLLDVPTLKIYAEDRVGFVGESGSGKTTLLESLGLLGWPRSISRFDLAMGSDGPMIDLLPPIIARDSNTLSAVRAKCMGFIVQDGGLLPYLSVYENALLAAELSGGSRDSRHDRIKTAAESMGLANYLHRMPSELSGGQRQRGAVLRALAPGAKLVFGDEPTASLDSSTSRDVMTQIAASAEAFQATVVVASHNIPLLAEFGFRLFRINVESSSDMRRATLRPEENS